MQAQFIRDKCRYALLLLPSPSRLYFVAAGKFSDVDSQKQQQAYWQKRQKYVHCVDRISEDVQIMILG